jgi:hypothetical protein
MSNEVAQKTAEPAAMDIKATVEKKDGMGFLQWVGVVGIGGALALFAAPKIMDALASNQEFLQKQLEAQQASQEKQQEAQAAVVRETATAMTQAAGAMDVLSETITQSVEESREFREDLSPLVRQLDRLADAVEEQAETEEPPP